ncbi:MAG: FapA family protein [Rhodocyclales bacterium]|nr:FapA family protein [Rhodocyclales bacterium]
MAQNDHHPALSATPPTAVTRPTSGTVADVAAGGIPLPDFIACGADGVLLDPAMLESPAQIQRFVDRVFAAGACFVGLDYAALSRLLYPPTAAPLSPAGAGEARIRIADSIADFASERRELYKAAKPADNGARIEYVFSPVRFERIVEVPIFGEVDADGLPVLTGYDKQVRYEPTSLNVDEFVAAMWARGIRSGIDIAAVRAAIASGRDERVDIARRIDPTPGSDATVQEQTEALHRDDSPSILPNGKVDLSHFKNHFPQVSAGTCLLKKQPRHLGVPGLDTDGTVLEAALPRDFELEELAGTGTRVERTAKGEFLVAARDGFLNIDTKSHQISITEKIVNREGVSLRTTGNLTLAGEHYEEHGEVQERRVVEGKHMIFHADVFGQIVSSGGHVRLHANLAGGAVRNTGGLIQIDGRASRAVLEAREGEVQAKYAESTIVIAGKVRLVRAVACDIVAEDVEIDEAIGCTIAARRIRIKRAGAHREGETLLTVCVPDFAVLDKRRSESGKEIDKLRRRIAAKQALLDERMATADIRKYIAADQRIRAGDLKLTPAQDEQWHQATQKLAGPLFQIQTLQKEMDALNANLSEHDGQLEALNSQRAAAGVDIRCEVAQVTGDVAVQTMAIPPDAAVFGGAEVGEIKHRLRDTRVVRQRLFRGESGRFAWTWTPPATS